MSPFKHHPILMFFVTVYLFTWLFWGTSVVQAWGWISFHLPQSLGYWIGLTMVSLLVSGLADGWSGIRDIMYRVLRWRTNPLWYLVALALTGAISAGTIGVYLALGGVPQIESGWNSMSTLWEFLFGIFFFTLTEELAWRGFALPRLQLKHNPLTASLILGALWGLWHIPLFLIPGSFQSGIPYFGFFLLTLAESIFTTWIFNHTRGSVLLTGIFHAASDYTIVILGVVTGDWRLFWIFVFIQWVFALFIVLTRRKEWLGFENKTAEMFYGVTSDAK
jgi:uncharacterized protein